MEKKQDVIILDKNELDTISFLANPLVKQSVLSIAKDYLPISKLGKDLLAFYLSMPNDYTPEEGSLCAFLYGKKYEDTEVTLSVAKLIKYSKISKEGIDSLIYSFGRQYRRKKILGAIEEFHKNKNDENLGLEGAEDLMIDTISEIKSSANTFMDLSDISNEDFDELVREEIGSGNSILQSSFKVITDASSFGGYIRGTINQFCAPPGVGKTMIMLAETIHFARQGYNIIWIALGDMMRSDFAIRCTALITGVPLRNVTISPEKYKTQEVKDILKHFRFNIVPASSVKVEDLVANLLSLPKESFDFQVIVIDYDDNLQMEGDNMYLEGGNTYAELTKIARKPKDFKLVMIASQVKQELWGVEILPENCCAQSSKKQTVIDMQVTINRNQKNNKIGTINIPKHRRGDMLKAKYRQTDCGEFQNISLSEYEALT